MLIFRREENRGFRYHLTLKSCSTEPGPLADMAISLEVWGLDAKTIIFLTFWAEPMIREHVYHVKFYYVNFPSSFDGEILH